ncbi:hypothetical protein [Alienimonas sp. DA493]|uniref:hypothetical protein n=1 Tax=Alienimonas sp. DA493 TaxID=3373605 RepID=UPI0037548984
MTYEHAAAGSGGSDLGEPSFYECYRCHGTGVLPGPEQEACLACRGSGAVSEERTFRLFRLEVLVRRAAERELGLEPGSPPPGVPEGGPFTVRRPDEETELKIWGVAGRIGSEIRKLPRDVLGVLCDLCGVPAPHRHARRRGRRESQIERPRRE